MNGEAKASAIVEVLDKLEAEHGTLTPDMIVKEAAKKTSPLHGEFEWDDKKAAYKFRVEQARKLVQRYHLYKETRTGVIVVPRYVRDPEAETGQQGYRSTARLKTDRERAVEALTNEAGRAAAYLQRVRNLAAGLGLESEVDEILERFEVFRGRVSL